MTVARFRIVALAESISWLALIVAMVLKRAFDVEGATELVGPIHGILFLVYVAAVAFLREELDWSLRRTVVAIVAAVVPLGAAIVVDRRYLTTGPSTSEPAASTR